MIKEQIQPINLDFTYNIGVVKVGRKSYSYKLYDGEEELDRFNSDKKPIELNKTSQHLNSFINILDGKNLKVQTTSGNSITISKDMIAKDVMACLSHLQDDIDSAKISEEKRKEEQGTKELEEIKEISHSEKEELVNLLDAHEMSLFTYIWLCATWLNGGETRNTLIGMICHLSTYLGIKPVWFLSLGKAGEGKSVIDESAQKMLPPEAFMEGRVSEASLYRKGMKYGVDYLDCKIMLMRDLGGDQDIEKWSDTIDRYKELTTEGKCHVEKVGDQIDEETGEKQILTLTLEGHCSASITSVRSESFDDQILSRGINVAPIASDEQVRLFAKYNEGIIADKRESVINHHIRKLHHLINNVKYEHGKVYVINPYWDCLEEWFRGTENYKRNLGIYPSFVKVITLLHYDFREKLTDEDGNIYVISTEEDNEIVAFLFNPSMGLTENAIQLFNKMVDWYRYNGVDDYEKISKEEYMEYSADNRNNITAYKHIFNVALVKDSANKVKSLRGLPFGEIVNNLVDKGFIRVLGKMNRGNNNVYALVQTEPITHRPIDFDEAKIKQYLKDMEHVYSVSSRDIWEIIKNENPIKTSPTPISDLGLPPWELKIPHESLELPQVPIMQGFNSLRPPKSPQKNDTPKTEEKP